MLVLVAYHGKDASCTGHVVHPEALLPQSHLHFTGMLHIGYFHEIKSTNLTNNQTNNFSLFVCL